MVDGIPLTLSDIGGWGLLIVLGGWLLRAIVRGDLVPRKTVDLLQQAAERREEQVNRLVDTIDTAADGIDTAVHFIQEVASAAAKRDETTDEAGAAP